MSLERAVDLARRGRLYPAVIVDGATVAARQAAALSLARTLLCEAAPEARPCGHCRHCRRIVWPSEEPGGFHPDFAVLERDLKIATSAAATKAFARVATVAPFEARGQVFVVASAETLSPEAGDALLKLLEEPPASAPRHFLLLAPTRLDLLPTLRSRSLAVYLGAAERLDPAVVARLAVAFGAAVDRFASHGAAVDLLLAAAALAAEGGFEDPRAGRPWGQVAAAIEAASRTRPAWRRRLLGLAEATLGAGELRLRAIGPERILEGLVARHLALPEPVPSIELR